MLNRFLVAAAVAALPAVAHADSITQLKNQPPNGAQATYLLTDGTVLAQGYSNSDFWVLTPDKTGSYVNGTWKQVGSLQAGYAPSADASQVLADGRVIIQGGEYSNGGQFTLTNQGAIYDPVKQTFSVLKAPPHWKNIGDSPSVVLADGRYFLGDKLHPRGAILDPKTMQWSVAGYMGKNDFNAEEGFTLMPDDSILTYDVQDHPQSEAWIPSKNKWVNRGSTVVDLQSPPCCGCINYPPKNKCYYPPGEVGPAVLRPDRTVFATGSLHSGASAGHTAIYTPGQGWAAGPDFPNGDDAGDNFASLLPNGDVLVEGSSCDLYIWDGTNLNDTRMCGGYSMQMILPTGQILIGGSEVYNSTSMYKNAWRPTISDFPSTVTGGSTYQISGTQFNGLSQGGGGMGDEYQTSTNYPLVQITNSSTKDVFFARTHDHSTMGVATGKKSVSTNFDVPKNAETGASTLIVIANGIPSTPVSITVQ
jgi:hypothetical protein